MANMILTVLISVLMFPTNVARRIVAVVGFCLHCLRCEVSYLYGDLKAGLRVCLRHLTVAWIVVVCMILVVSFMVVGVLPSLTLFGIIAICVGGKYGGRVPRYVTAHWEKIKEAWERGVDDDDCTTPTAEICMERVPSKLRPRLACKIAVRAVSKVGLLKRSEANALVYQRVCLDVMEAMKMRWHDRLMILPQAVLACMERPREVEEVMKAIEASCKGRFDEF